MQVTLQAPLPGCSLHLMSLRQLPELHEMSHELAALHRTLSPQELFEQATVHVPEPGMLPHSTSLAQLLLPLQVTSHTPLPHLTPFLQDRSPVQPTTQSLALEQSIWLGQALVEPQLKVQL